MAMFDVTAGALAVQVRSEWFSQDQIPHRILQAVFATAKDIKQRAPEGQKATTTTLVAPL